MQCEQFEATWQRLLDERRSPEADPHLLAHSLVCSRCAELLDSTHILQCGLEMAPPNDLAPDFAEQIVAQIVSPARPERGRPTAAPNPARSVDKAPPHSHGKSMWWLLAAAALLMAVVTQYPHLGSSHVQPHAPPHRSVAIIDNQPSPGSLPTMESIGSTAPQEVQLHAILADLAERFPKDEATKAITTHIQRLDSATRPLARSFGTAFTAIYRSVGKPADSDKSANLSFTGRNVA